MKKRSSVVPRTDSPSASSSSSSCVVDHQNDEPKRVRRKTRPDTNSPITNANATTAITNRRSSIYRGVTRHRWTGRFEAHLWDKSCWNTIQNKKGRQVYLGAYDSEMDAARTYDLAALKYWGPQTTLNFPIENYTKEVEEMQNVSKEEYLATLRRRSSGFSRGVSKYRGVARHHHNGRWEARIGRVFGNKYLYLGTFSSQEEAAEAYDLAAIEYRGPNAVTNFDISNYIGRVKNLVPTDTQSENPNLNQTKPEKQPKQKQKQKRQIKKPKEEDEQQDQPEIAMPSHHFEESKLNNNPNNDSPMLVMSQHDDDEDIENPWSFCLDMGGFDPLLFPDIPLEEDESLLDLFDQTGFEDNIDFFFEGETDDGIKSSEESNKEMEILTNIHKTLSFSSSSSSTASLVSCEL